ncbi:type II secretion system protein N [Geobacter sp. AOG1]|uniref:type II secretion system protein N n=1 Tax=Geobacter sp. AOG1 TaxID=1566346 RepID=UPI001CC65594|nr:type II secretion system protein N [Geobacter sp. AOG1]GFE57262.1 general secretion pathway protein GspC [Geobacter sp. AOG1]
MQKWVFPLNIALTLLILSVVALIASDLVSFRLGKLFPSGTKTQALTIPPPATDDLMSFAPILTKGLFGKATQGQLTPITAASSAKQGGGTSQSDLLLLGTARGSFRETFALIQKISTKEERVFRLGDQVYGMGPLVAVQKESAEILAGGQKVKILTPTAVATEAASSQPPAPGSGGLAAQVGTGNYVIDQRALNAALDNIGQAMTDARLLPSVKDGKVEGFRVSEVRQGGIFGTVGMKNGDVLLRINEFPIDSPEKAIQSLASLKGQSRIKLDLVRDGQPTTFNYDIR